MTSSKRSRQVRSGRQVAVVGVGHDRLDVGPLRVRDQHQPLAGLELVEQRLRRLRVEDDVGLRVGHDVGLERTLDVGLVEPLADLAKKILVAVDLGQDMLVVEVDQL